jgi:hypothetical protein
VSRWDASTTVNHSTQILNGYKGGRPAHCSKRLAKAICKEITNSTWSLARLCEQHPEWPDYFAIAKQMERKPWFRQMVMDARAKQADLMAMATQDVAKETLADPQNMAKVQAARLVCENTRWYAGKIYRRLYGEESVVNVDARTAVVVG